MKFIFSILALTIGLTATAHAATWNGIYVGVNGTYGVSRDTGVVQCINPANIKNGPGCTAPIFPSPIITHGFMGGIQIGDNRQIGKFVFGPEFDYDAGSLFGAASIFPIPALPSDLLPARYTTNERLTWLATARLRAGWTVTSHALLYVTGGYVESHENLSTALTSSGSNYFNTTNLNQSGWSEGLGLEYRLSNKVSVRIQGLGYQLEPHTLLATSITNLGWHVGKDFYFNGSTVETGVDFKI